MQFQIVALHILEDCDQSFSKALAPDTIYPFYRAYDFRDYKEKDIILLEQDNIDLYSFEHASVSINAIAGKNGSGKSTITEIIFAMIFELSQRKGIEFIKNSNIRKEHEFDRVQSQQYDKDVKALDGLRCELFFKVENDIYVLYKSAEFGIRKYELKDSSFFRNAVAPKLDKDFLRNLFHYTIAINYSLHGLNTQDGRLWLKPLFHKNDSYQTPLVLNPMRSDGQIDINKITHLSKARLLSNILQPIEKDIEPANSLRALVNGKVAKDIILRFDYSKFGSKERGINKGDLRFEYFDKYKNKVFPKLLNAFRNLDEEELSKKEVNLMCIQATNIEKACIEYAIRKLERIAKTYRIKGIDFKNFSLDEPHSVTGLLDMLEDDYSHITFKLRQVINFFRYQLPNVNRQEMDQKLDVEEYSQQLNSLLASLKEKRAVQDGFKVKTKESNDGVSLEFDGFDLSMFEIINFLPPSIFSLDIEFRDRGSYNQLSSGEKQKVFTISSILYHLVNLKSIDGEFLVRYNYFHLILDEIELYFHPEFQRTFIKDLLKAIKQTRIRFDGFNIMFITHSPFILSDIPKSNILFLDVDKKTGLASPQEGQETFASNIHEMLAHSFYMNSTKGAMATDHINEFVNFYGQVKEVIEDEAQLEKLKVTFEERKEYYIKLITIIGEDYIREVLLNQYNHLIELFESANLDPIDKKIVSLRKQLENLEQLKQANNVIDKLS